MPIFKDEIEQLFSKSMYMRGLLYYNQGRVQSLYYVERDNRWRGKVIGTGAYDVTVTILDDHVDFRCDCLAFFDYGECKHAAACLFEIADKQEKEDPFILETKKKREQQKVINHFIDVFSTYQQTEAYSHEQFIKDPLNVEFIIKTQLSSNYGASSVWAIEMKTGVNRVYVVKDLNKFLQAVEMNNSYFFTKNFSYDPTEQVFTKQDFAVIQLLIQISKNEAAYNDRYYSYRGDERAVMVPPMMVDTLLEMLMETNFTFESYNHSYTSLEIIENEIPLAFRLEKGEADDFQLDISELANVELFELYGYLQKGYQLYKLTSEQQRIIEELQTGFDTTSSIYKGQHIPIAKDQIESFLSVAIPEMKKIGTLDISEQVSNQIRQFPLQAKILVDSDGETLQVDVEYHYGDVTINPFLPSAPDEEKEEGLTVRDMRKEQEIMTAIEDASLKYNGKKLYVEGEEDIYYFLFHTLPYLEDKANIFLTNEVKSLLLPDSYAPTTTFDFNNDGSLLEVSFDMKDVEPDHIQQILKSVVEKKKYYRLPNGAFVSIEGNQQMQNIQQLYSELNINKAELNGSTLQLPVYRALQVDDLIQEDTKLKIKIGKQFRKLIQSLKNPDELDFELPVDLQADLREYQTLGFQWLKTLATYSLGGILADDMGLGKTLQAIAFLLSEKQEQKLTNPALVVAPASLVYNWKSELEKFAPSLDAEVVIGTPSEREAILQQESQPNVLITSYPLLRQDIDLYKDQQFSCLFLDEAQAIKNHITKTSKAVRDIRAGKRFALSGTPIENSLDELWALFQAVLPGFFPSQQAFRKLSEEKISKMARPFILRRLKKDVLTELPDKIETTQVSELTQQQKELYMGYLEKIQKETIASLQGEGLNRSRIKILAGLTRLRQLCCHPSLFIENYEGSSGKLEQLIEIVGNAKENKKRMLIFSQFTSMLHIIRKQLDEAGLSYFYIDGKTPSKERVEMVNRFNEGENDVFLISLKAGGTGLNLTGADTVILYDLWWNPAVEDQAADRAHRMGQKNVVQVIRLLSKGTIEEKIYQLQQRKKELIEKVIQPGDTMLSSLSEQEIKELLSI
ncbi:SNF2 helicase associated domain-containing protein [Radiobacillus sp. PE A8.2]|uniref:SNF2 helicase associated domain-containing protein n=1 Tax=Radiobacillus sp. PE A8.2 TaxID=3380349 RepID=UPI00388EE29A